MAVKLADTLAPMGDFEIAKAKDVSVEIGGTTKMLQTAIDNGEIGGGGSSTFVGTQAEWEALLPTEKEKYEFVDFTDDVDGALIDDTEAHTNKVYSSSKVESYVAEITGKNEVLSNGVDFNTITDNGIYRISNVSNAKNIPYGFDETSWGYLKVTNITDNYFLQELSLIKSGIPYSFIRRKYGNNWSAWTEFATNKKFEINDYSFNSTYATDAYHEFYSENGTVHIRGLLKAKANIPANTIVTLITLGSGYSPKGGGGFQVSTDAFAKLYSMSTTDNGKGICWIYSDIQIPKDAYLTYEASWRID